MTTESHDYEPDGSAIPAGWELVERSEYRNGIMLRFVRLGRADASPHWVTASGDTLPEAMASGRERMDLFDAVDRRPRE